MSILTLRRKNIFRLGGILWLWLAALPPALAVKPMTSNSARKQVYQRAVEAASSDINRVAQQKNWRNFHSKLNVFIPAEVSSFRPCSRPLSVALPQGDRLDLARLRYDIRCEGNSSWELAVTVKPDIYLPVVVAKNTLERGSNVRAEDIELKKRNITSSRGGYLIDPDEAIGLTVKKRIRDMQVIAPSQLDSPLLVDRGQKVLMIAEQDGVEARMMGEALKKGRKGDMIKVRNLSSKIVVSAVVDQAGVVRMLYAPGQS
ncbi:Flagella basal body P-ring formation protein FlgA [Paramixta manurensis]|uniref:Flagella basal body P-ring formation protein FlgA n=1 Tax=Paramixta manurensis TaxID=2740817 RepID=A0A6M8U7N1_9GAMM|nr:Flagella basal body P-ring formation protein FlgA [Erwiniaceae bacterium PD-1]